MDILRRGVLPFVLLLAVCTVSCFGWSGNGVGIFTLAQYEARPTVIIDPGHGGFDGGAVASDGTVEKNINLNISLTLSKLLKQNGFYVIMTRETDVSTDNTESSQIFSKKRSDLENRLNLMRDNPEAVFVSIHLNKFTTSSAEGSQVFYSKGEQSYALAQKVQGAIVGLIQPENTRVNKQATSSTYLLYNATVPAILVECGFLSNAYELEKLKSRDYQNKMAFGIYCGIAEYFKENGNGE